MSNLKAMTVGYLEAKGAEIKSVTIYITETINGLKFVDGSKSRAPAWLKKMVEANKLDDKVIDSHACVIDVTHAATYHEIVIAYGDDKVDEDVLEDTMKRYRAGASVVKRRNAEAMPNYVDYNRMISEAFMAGDEDTAAMDDDTEVEF